MLKIQKYLRLFPLAAHYYGSWPNFFRALALRLIYQGILGGKKLFEPFVSLSAVQKLPSKTLPLPIKYVIWAPDYGENSAGVRCLYLLCDALNRQGYSSVVAGSKIGPDHLQAPIVTKTFARKALSNSAFAIYPETISGNPLRASKVARWVLNKPGWISGDKIFDSRELIFYYAEGYRAAIQNNIAGKLYLPTIDEKIFFDDGVPTEKRGLECFYVGKSKFKAGLFDTSRVFEITRHSPPRSELGKLFRASKTLYCFDNTTALSIEAVMCGCRVVIIPDGTQERADYLNGELGMEGIAWGIDELQTLKPNPAAMKIKYDQLKMDFEVQLQNFIKITQN